MSLGPPFLFLFFLLLLVLEILYCSKNRLTSLDHSIPVPGGDRIVGLQSKRIFHNPLQGIKINLCLRAY